MVTAGEFDHLGEIRSQTKSKDGARIHPLNDIFAVSHNTKDTLSSKQTNQFGLKFKEEGNFRIRTADINPKPFDVQSAVSN
mmetsp:Transcript_33616/g.51797  ORF Transcript_33616/g.51797 Transcript_33616/m.51797 type:complete len:81 (-) Transcript_33616:695-937(-)